MMVSKKGKVLNKASPINSYGRKQTKKGMRIEFLRIKKEILTRQSSEADLDFPSP
jgi:hypothetical protein